MNNTTAPATQPTIYNTLIYWSGKRSSPTSAYGTVASFNQDSAHRDQPFITEYESVADAIAQFGEVKDAPRAFQVWHAEGYNGPVWEIANSNLWYEGCPLISDYVELMRDNIDAHEVKFFYGSNWKELFRAVEKARGWASKNDRTHIQWLSNLV